MKFQIVSDLHSEFMKDGGKSFARKLPVEAPVLVVAGDAGNVRTTTAFIQELEKRWDVVLFVAGNHEYYGGQLTAVDQELSLRPGFLKRRVVELDGVKVAGTTLWFRQWAPWKELLINDFRCIEGLKEQVLEENRLDEEFIRNVVGEVDLIITHHIPTWTGVAKKFLNSPLNDFFVTPIADELETLPKAWVFGHTHIGKQFKMKECQFICNPRGYGGEGRFDRRLVWETKVLSGVC